MMGADNYERLAVGSIRLKLPDVLGRGDAHLGAEYTGKILGVGVAAPLGDVCNTGKSLLDHGTGILDADGVQIFDDTGTQILFEYAGDVFFVVGQVGADLLQREILVGVMLVDIALDLIRTLALPWGKIFLQQTVAKTGKGIQQNSLTHHIRYTAVRVHGLAPKRLDRGGIGKVKVIIPDPQAFHDPVPADAHEADVHIGKILAGFDGKGTTREGKKQIALPQGCDPARRVKVSLPLAYIVHFVYGFRLQSCAQLWLGLQYKMDGMKCIEIFAEGDKMADVMLHRHQPFLLSSISARRLQVKRKLTLFL